jgi:hypothetical protein
MFILDQLVLTFFVHHSLTVLSNHSKNLESRNRSHGLCLGSVSWDTYFTESTTGNVIDEKTSLFHVFMALKKFLLFFKCCAFSRSKHDSKLMSLSDLTEFWFCVDHKPKTLWVTNTVDTADVFHIYIYIYNTMFIPDQLVFFSLHYSFYQNTMGKCGRWKKCYFSCIYDTEENLAIFKSYAI